MSVTYPVVNEYVTRYVKSRKHGCIKCMLTLVPTLKRLPCPSLCLKSKTYKIKLCWTLNILKDSIKDLISHRKWEGNK